MLGRLMAGNSLTVDQQRLQHSRVNHGNVLEKGKVHDKFVIFLKSTFILITCAAYYTA